MSAQYISGVSHGFPDSVRVHVSAILPSFEIDVGEESRIDGATVITGHVKLGRRVHIGHGAGIFGMADVVIGDGSSISPGVKIFTGTDDLKSGKLSNPCLPDRVVKSGPVWIGANVTIGANSVIGPGVTIGDNAVVGALSLVTRDVGAGEIVAGIPAKVLRAR